MRIINRGLTLIEILVVIFILGLLLAILFPVVNRIRESSRRTTCQNNLRQIAIAVQSYESSKRMLPPLWFGTSLKHPRHTWDEFHFHSWQTAILPQLEEEALYQQLDLSTWATSHANQLGINVRVPTFTCPSTPNQNAKVLDIMKFNDGAAPTKIVGTAARSDFEAVAGVYSPPKFPTKTSADLRGIRFGVWGDPQYDVKTGKITRVRTARFRDVSDGLSKSIMVGERAGRPDLHKRGKLVNLYPYSNPDDAMDHAQAAWGISTNIWWLVFGYNQSINQTNRNGLFSFHTSGANIALADGSVRFLSEQTDLKTLQALATRSGGDEARLD